MYLICYIKFQLDSSASLSCSNFYFISLVAVFLDSLCPFVSCLILFFLTTCVPDKENTVFFMLFFLKHSCAGTHLCGNVFVRGTMSSGWAISLGKKQSLHFLALWSQPVFHRSSIRWNFFENSCPH